MHGLTPETAWYMLHRLREAMKREPLAGALRGVIVADETWIGGERKNRHANKKGPWSGDKTPVLALVNKETGEVRSQVMQYVTRSTIQKALTEQIDTSASTLHTDSSPSYIEVGGKFIKHQAVNHSAGEYVRGPVSTNPAESYFAQLKRSIDGTHHHVTRGHLHRYVAEFDFRYSTSKMADAQRLQIMVDRSAGRRLSYRPLTDR